METTKKVGTVFVDAGLVWVGDPCYVMGDNATSRVTDWLEFCNKLGGDVSEPLGKGIGMAISSGLGDGEYPVYVTTKDMGVWGKRVSKIEIDFQLDDKGEDMAELVRQ